MIKTFVARPVKVQGIVWDGSNFEEIKAFCNGLAHVRRGHGKIVLTIETLEGSMRAQIGDTIIRGTQGEFYPVKPNVMAEKYNALDE